MNFFLGGFQFINLSRVVSAPTQRLLREVRPGVNGVTFWQTGRRASPIHLASVVDTPTVEAAEALIHQYELVVGTGPLPVVWAGIVREDVMAIVHGVEPIEEGVHATLLGIGGVLGTSGALCRALWTVEPIDPFFTQ